MNLQDDGRWRHTFHVSFRAGYFAIGDPEEDRLNLDYKLVFPSKTGKWDEIGCGQMYERGGSRNIRVFLEGVF